MAKQAVKSTENQDSYLEKTEEPTIIDKYRELNDKVDTVLEKISKRKKNK